MTLARNKLFLSFYGDDFTGSTDVMETLALNGMPTALFLSVPTREEVHQFTLKRGVGGETIRAFGVAGIARSLSPEGMKQELPPIFSAMSQIPTDYMQYKVCSTLDSSPTLGNIGVATDIASQYFPSPRIPMLIGAPFLNRFVVFGNLFARINDLTYRLDRHPVMAHHPATPMKESDIRVHIGHQTSRVFQLIDLHALQLEYDELQQMYAAGEMTDGSFVLFDTLSYQDLETAARLVYESWSGNTQLLVASSGLTYGLARYVHANEIYQSIPQIHYPDAATHLLVVAGSCSPVTAEQVRYAESHGFTLIKAQIAELIEDPQSELTRIETIVLKEMTNGRHVVVYTADGPQDPTIKEVQEYIGDESIQVIGHLLAEIVKMTLESFSGVRLVVAGGDTSGYVTRSLKIYALEMICPIAPGAPLCAAHARDPRYDGLEIALKGGQNGNYDYFNCVLNPTEHVASIS